MAASDRCTWRSVAASRGGSNVVLRPACALTQSVKQLEPQLTALMRILMFRGYSMACLRLWIFCRERLPRDASGTQLTAVAADPGLHAAGARQSIGEH